jgi:hypothetical protein
VVSLARRVTPDDLTLSATQGALNLPGSPATRPCMRAIHRLKSVQLPLWPCSRYVAQGGLTEQVDVCGKPPEVTYANDAGADADD